MSINDWKMQEEIQNESRRITESNLYDGCLKSEKKLKKTRKTKNLLIGLSLIILICLKKIFKI